MSTQLAKCDALLHRHPRTVILATLAALGAPWVVDNYRRYLALGKSALTPLGPFGWLLALSLTAFGRETVSTKEYESTEATSWLETPVERRGVRPEIGWHCRLDAIFEKHVEANPTLVQVVVSPHEKLDPVVIHPDIASPHKDAVQALREIAHVHPADHSLHVVLSPADSKTAIDLGWAERHPLSGVSRILPLPNNYLLVYAPRDEEELDVVNALSRSVA
ncbi:hypothetical protein C8R46DRAFT_1157034 [Mycena filopes]|nr:hypothetical protein C8R46DRAFT_1157034 [Mycena filopes]